MLKLPTPAQLKARRASRKRGFAIENVALGMIVILFATALLYGAFTVIQRNISKNTAQRVMPMASSEARLLYRNSPSFTGLTTLQLISAGAIPLDSVQDEAGTPSFVLPFGGEVEFYVNAANADSFDATVTWPDNRNARALCTTMSAGPVGSVISGPMGSEYVITSDPTSDCDAGSPPTLSVQYLRG